MKILGIEASGLVASAAVVEDGVLRAEFTIGNRLTHSQTLLPMVETMLSISGETLSEISAIAVSEGPGSFTGLRIGAATVKGLALAADLPVIAVSSLRALSENVSDAEQPVTALMDARRGQVYCGAWRAGEPLFEEKACAIGELISELNRFYRDGSLSGTMLFLGDGVPVHRELISEQAEFPLCFVSANNNRQRASSVAQLGYGLFSAWLSGAGLTPEAVKEQGADALRAYYKGAVMNSDDFAPSYLRKPQAEREKDAGLLEDPGQKSLRKIARGEK